MPETSACSIRAVKRALSQLNVRPSKQRGQSFLVSRKAAERIAAAAKLAPGDTVLEIGSNAGQNLFLLAQRFPEARFYGIDINSRFIEAGRNWLADNGITNVSLTVKRADRVSDFADQSFDIVFTDATMMYIGPDKIRRLLREMKRVACKAILMNEWHLERANSANPSLWYDLHWVHNYRLLLEGLVPPDKISIAKLPEELWGAGGWEEYGSLVEIDVT